MTQEDCSKASVLVLGIDPGTTSFKCAMLTVEEDADTLQLVNRLKNGPASLSDFPGYQHTELYSISTSLIYNTEGNLNKWGHEGTNFQDDEDFNPNLLVTNWKIGLHQSRDLTARRLRSKLEVTAQRLGKQLEDFVEDFFEALGSYLFKDKRSPVLNSFGGTLDVLKYIDVIIAVPPGWPRQEHRIFSRAASLGLAHIPRLRVFTASETECVLRAWMLDQGSTFVKIGDIVILLDLGGGTACISVFHYSLDNGNPRWSHAESHSLTAGSEMVTEEFVTDFQNRLHGIFNEEKISKLVYEARKTFNMKKLRLGDENDRKDWAVRVKGLSRDIAKGFEKNHVIFSYEKLMSYFTASQDVLITKFQEVLKTTTENLGRPNHCLVAGAYGRNRIFQEKLKAANTLGMKLFLPSNAAELVVKGACHARVYGDFHQLSGSRYSIGIKTYILHSEAKEIYPLAYKRKFPGDVKWWSPVIQWVVKKGDHVERSHEIDSGGGRKRYFEPTEDIRFTDTIVTSEFHPGDTEYTCLRYSTANDTAWLRNEEDLRKRDIHLDASEFTWDICNTIVRQRDGTWGPFSRTALPQDPKDKRRRKRRILVYEYYLTISQADVQISIETILRGNVKNRLIVGQKNVHVGETSELESTALRDEYDNLPQEENFGENLATELQPDGAFVEARDSHEATATTPHYGPGVPGAVSQSQSSSPLRNGHPADGNDNGSTLNDTISQRKVLYSGSHSSSRASRLGQTDRGGEFSPLLATIPTTETLFPIAPIAAVSTVMGISKRMPHLGRDSSHSRSTFTPVNAAQKKELPVAMTEVSGTPRHETSVSANSIPTSQNPYRASTYLKRKEPTIYDFSGSDSEGEYRPRPTKSRPSLRIPVVKSRERRGSASKRRHV